MDQKWIDFINEHEELIEDDNWEEFYKLAGKYCETNYMKLGSITYILHEAGIHPENYLEELPDYFMAYYDGLMVSQEGKSSPHFRIPTNIMRIGKEAFELCELLTSVDIPDSVKVIKSLAFHCCGFKHFDFPASVDTIPGGCFWYCEDLESIHIPRSVTSIASEAFVGCKRLLSVYYDGTVEEWNQVQTATHTFKDVPAKIVHCIDGDTKLRKKIEHKK